MEYLDIGGGKKRLVGNGVTPICGHDSSGNPAKLASEGTIEDFRKKSFGLNGGKYVTGTSANTGDTWVAIQALEDTVIASMTATNLSGTLTSMPLPAGSIIYGVITAFTLTSGKVIAYKA